MKLTDSVRLHTSCSSYDPLFSTIAFLFPHTLILSSSSCSVQSGTYWLFFFYFWKQPSPPSVVLYFLTVSVPPFHWLCSRPLVRWAKSSYSQLDPIGLISPTVYLFAFRCLISWGVVHLSPSTKHWLSVYFKPLFTRGKLAEDLSPPPALRVTFVRIYSHQRRPHSLLSATEPVIVRSTLRNSWSLLVLWSNYLMNGSPLCFLQYFTLYSRGQTWKQLVTL